MVSEQLKAACEAKSIDEIDAAVAEAERLGIEAWAEIKAVNTWRVSNRAQYDAAMAAASQMVRPGTINMTVTIPEDE